MNVTISRKIGGFFSAFSKPIIRQISINASNKSVEFEEVQIPMPWGHIAGKLWNPNKSRPILTVHGWEDNAGSFDRLIPLLPSDMSYLAIDLPGHGFSSKLPIGMFYHLTDTVHWISTIKTYFGWDKVSLMGHSLGAMINFIYSSMYPDSCDFAISIDILRPAIREPNDVIYHLLLYYEMFSKDEKRQLSKTPPHTYTYKELEKRLIIGSGNSITSETAKYLLNRGAKLSENDPNHYYFIRDFRIKCCNIAPYDRDFIAEMIKRRKTPYLFFKASDTPYFEKQKTFEESIELLLAHNTYFEYVHVKGNHHVHLVSPELLSEKISTFINKYK